MSSPIRVAHFSDVLCVWAYVGQRRMDELRDEFGDRIAIECRLFSVFGFARTKIGERWNDKGGMAAYACHVREVIERFGHVELHEGAWARVAPTSSSPAHLMLAAVRVLEAAGQAPQGAFVQTAWRVRQAFFRDARDVSRHEILLDLVAEASLDVGAVREQLASGVAHAELARDEHQARDLDVRVSPSILMNEGRQRLNGNVGYRVLAANVREILETPSGQQSWC